MLDSDRRLYDAMIGMLDRFEGGQATVADVSMELEALLSALDSPAAPWKDDLLSEWGKFEDIRSAMEFRQEQAIDANARELLLTASVRLKNLINSASEG